MSRKKIIAIVAAGIVAVAAVIGGVWYFTRGNSQGGKAADKVYVQKISEIQSWNNGTVSSYAGVVESQETWEVNKDSSKEIKELLVAVGDTVEAGTPLFTYDTKEAENQIAQLKLDIESVNNDISNYNSQIAELQKEKKSAPEDQQFEYTTQIQTLQTSIKQSEYDLKSKQVEIDKQQQTIDNATVTSKIPGVVKTINDSGVEASGNSSAYMTILATGDYRVKGRIDEQNVSMLNVGQAVVVRSRVDEAQTWNGTITAIDTETAEKDNNNGSMYGSDDSSTQSATKYPFYITLDSTDGLILGQHVYIEPDYGQTVAKEGIWLDESYIVTDDGDPYVWAADSKMKLEKRKVTLGEHDDEQFQYEITSGLTEEDSITWPMDGLYEGVTAVTDESEVDYSSPLYNTQGTEDMDAGYLGDGSETYDMEEYMQDTEAGNWDEAGSSDKDGMQPVVDGEPEVGQ